MAAVALSTVVSGLGVFGDLYPSSPGPSPGRQYGPPLMIMNGNIIFELE